MKQETIIQTENRKYHYALGRRKSSTATLRLYPKGSGKFTVNGKDLSKYLPTSHLQEAALKALTVTNTADQYDATIKVSGGGVRGQSDAIKLAFARALVSTDEAYKIPVKRAGLLTRDARVKERKKYGLKKARRAPQWSKR